MSVGTVHLGAFFLESTGLVNVEAVFTVSAMREVLALNMLKED